LVLFFEKIEFAGFFKIKSQVSQNTEDIKTIAILIRSVLTKHELEWLVGLAKNESIITDTRIKHTYDGFKDGFVHMRGLGFIENKIVGGGLSDLEKGDPGPRDARNYFIITKQGREFLQHLERLSGKTVGELVNS
jgi:hypothetical protein